VAYYGNLTLSLPLLSDNLSRAMRPQTNTNLSLKLAIGCVISTISLEGGKIISVRDESLMHGFA
jgi:hypothetical protein